MFRIRGNAAVTASPLTEIDQLATFGAERFVRIRCNPSNRFATSRTLDDSISHNRQISNTVGEGSRLVCPTLSGVHYYQ